MNITVVTPYDSSNFGAYLQAYCLSSWLKNRGYNVTHIPTRPADYVESLYFSRVPVSKKEKLIPAVYRKHVEFGKRKYEIFKEAQKAFRITEDLSETDLAVLGSDEIWNVEKTVFNSSVFWGSMDVPSISYAASIGDASPDAFRFRPDQVDQLRRLRRALVRDENTRRFVEEYSDLKADLVCDPTILWPVDRYGEECTDEYVSSHDCLLVYAYAVTKKEKREIIKYARAKKLKIVTCCFYHGWSDHQVECSPLAFSDLIRKCRLFYTSSFHGTVFGMLNHANFVVSTDNPKTLHLISQYGLEDRLLSKKEMSAEGMADIYARKAGYREADRRAAQWRERSGALLQEAIQEATCQAAGKESGTALPKPAGNTAVPEEAAEKAAAMAAADLPESAGDTAVPEEAAEKAAAMAAADLPETAGESAASEEAASKATVKGADKVFDPLICFHNQCTGCFACRAVCGKDAISIITDAQGRTLPEIDPEKCISCGACRKVCPQRNPALLHAPEECYAARGRNFKGIHNSSSGGISAILAETFTRNGKSVCGAVVADGRVVHRIIRAGENPAPLQGSKYVQSDISGVYGEIRKELREGREVLFFGTPCQVDAVNRLFGKNEKFFSVDIICHGVPPVDYLNSHLKNITGGRKYDRFRFRGYPDDYTLKIYDGEEAFYSKTVNEDPYFYGFLNGVIMRENCYNCRYTRSSRTGDLTIGDFWGIDRKTLKNSYDGNISVVLVNTEKGKELFGMIRPELVCEIRETREAVAGNPQLRRPSMRHGGRAGFLRVYMETGDFEKAIAAAGIDKAMKRMQFGSTGPGKVYVFLKKAWQRR